MTTNEIMENCRKNKGYTYKITHISAAKCPVSVVLYANDQILFFIFIDENIGNFRKITDKLGLYQQIYLLVYLG